MAFVFGAAFISGFFTSEYKHELSRAAEEAVTEAAVQIINEANEETILTCEERAKANGACKNASGKDFSKTVCSAEVSKRCDPNNPNYLGK